MRRQHYPKIMTSYAATADWCFFCEQIIHKNDFKTHFKATKIAFK